MGNPTPSHDSSFSRFARKDRQTRRRSLARRHRRQYSLDLRQPFSQHSWHAEPDRRDHSEFKVGMVFFGIHVASTGYLILRSALIPRIIGGILVAGGSSYMITSFATFVAPAVGARMSPLVIPIAILGEGSLTLWLLFKGVNTTASVC